MLTNFSFIICISFIFLNNFPCPVGSSIYDEWSHSQIKGFRSSTIQKTLENIRTFRSVANFKTDVSIGFGNRKLLFHKIESVTVPNTIISILVDEFIGISENSLAVGTGWMFFQVWPITQSKACTSNRTSNLLGSLHLGVL